MAWESRNGRGRYYTRSRKVNGRIVREYVGSGELAELLAEQDEIQREARRLQAEAWQKEKARLQAEAQAVAALCAEVDLLASAVLLEAGFYRPDRGQWRQKRSWSNDKKDTRRKKEARQPG